MLLRLRQSWKALKPISVTLSGISTFERLLQPTKEAAPIDVTLSGIVMLVRLVQHGNAPMPIEVISPLNSIDNMSSLE